MFRRDDPQELQIPGICALCMGSTLPMVDTLRQNSVAPGHPLRGKQYVCTECVAVLSEVLGLFQADADVKKLERQVSYWQRKAQKEGELADSLRKLLGPQDADES